MGREGRVGEEKMGVLFWSQRLKEWYWAVNQNNNNKLNFRDKLGKGYSQDI